MVSMDPTDTWITRTDRKLLTFTHVTTSWCVCVIHTESLQGFYSLSLTRLCAAGLGEFRIRDLNDEINKLLREKGHWEVRIKELGGPDYAVRDCI